MLGDAAWCVTPLGGGGSSPALLGAYVLAAQLSTAPGDVEAGLRRCEQWRRPVVQRTGVRLASTAAAAHPCSRKQAPVQRITEFPYEVRVIEDWIPLSDGTRLWMRAWRPVTDEAVPGILEYLPYRAGDWSAPRDHERHPYYAGHGYASIRVDIRGHGSSDGVPGDEYDAQEQADGLEVIDRIAAQDWCTGRVGMVGISWGGFSALQLASHRPEPLRAIVTVCSSDDRYDNDVHYTGGSMLAVDQLAWAATMLAFESRPPDPRVAGDAWRRMWLHRLEQMEPYLDGWLGHQLRDGYWEHGSVCEDHSSIDAAVLAVGGWHDPYRDTVLRLVEHLSALGRDAGSPKPPGRRPTSCRPPTGSPTRTSRRRPRHWAGTRGRGAAS